MIGIISETAIVEMDIRVAPLWFMKELVSIVQENTDVFRGLLSRTENMRELSSRMAKWKYVIES